MGRTLKKLKERNLGMNVDLNAIEVIFSLMQYIHRDLLNIGHH